MSKGMRWHKAVDLLVRRGYEPFVPYVDGHELTTVRPRRTMERGVANVMVHLHSDGKVSMTMDTSWQDGVPEAGHAYDAVMKLLETG